MINCKVQQWWAGAGLAEGLSVPASLCGVGVWSCKLPWGLGTGFSGAWQCQINSWAR